jgi:hypothetical protein
MPGINAREVVLPSNVVIDLTRSNLPATTLDLLCQPDGTWAPSLQYGVPTSIRMDGSWFQFWLAERADVGGQAPKGQWRLVNINGRSGNVTTTDQPDLVTGLATARQE